MSDAVSHDVNSFLLWLHTAVELEDKRDEKREEIKQLLVSTFRLAKEMHGLPSENDFTTEDEHTLTVLAHCLEFWTEQDRRVLDDEWEEAELNPIIATISTLGKTYADAAKTPKLEIRVLRKDSVRIPITHGIRKPINLTLGSRHFKAGLRSNAQFTQICPDLLEDGVPCTLGAVLTSLNLNAKDRLELAIVRSDCRARPRKET